MMIRYIVAVLLALHGLINVMGFVATWGLGKLPISQTPQLLPRLTPGGGIDRILGVLWLLACIGLLAGVFGLASAAVWWKGLVAGAAVLSLALCLAWWTDAKAGAVIDIVILVGLAMTTWVSRPVAA